jgi:hypothetical protein
MFLNGRNQNITFISRRQTFANYRARVMVFNANFNNISVISWRSVLLVEETRVPEKTTAHMLLTNFIT